MFYHVAKGQKDKDDKKRRERNRNSSDIENLSEMEPGLWGRTLQKDRARSRSPRPGSGSRSHIRGGIDTTLDFPDDESATGEGYRSDDYYDEEELDEYIHVPNCMLGQPLKDFDSGQENVSLFLYFLIKKKLCGKNIKYSTSQFSAGHSTKQK